MLTKAPKGTRDVLITDVYRWQYIENEIRNLCRVFGYQEERTPIFEHTELFLRGVGDTTDVVQKEMYTFEDKGGRSITLRPEGTAGAVRSFIESGLASGPQPTKMYYLSAPVFRYENPQAGRLREHHQFGIEVFGAKDASIDAEVILVALTLFSKLGIEDLQLNINSIGCDQCRPVYHQKLKEYLKANYDGLCSTCKERFERNPLRILDCKEEGCRQIAKGAPVIIDHLCGECQQHFESLQGYLKAMNIPFAINPFIVRGLDYYTKTVFEIISTNIGSQGTVCGGGRYDKLVKTLGGPDMPGIGFGMGIERLLMIMENAGLEVPKPSVTDVYVCPMGDQTRQKAFQLVMELRGQGIKADMDHCQKSLKAQMKYANKLGVRYTAVLGEEEIAAGQITLRDMENSTEKKVPIGEIGANLDL